MLLLILIAEYISGEVFFELLDGYYGYVDLNIVYYITVSCIDAFVCSIVIKVNNKSYLLYAIISLILAFIHIYGLYVYSSRLEAAIYGNLIIAGFVIKLMIAVVPNGDNSIHSIRTAISSMVHRCYYACATRICWVCL